MDVEEFVVRSADTISLNCIINKIVFSFVLSVRLPLPSIVMVCSPERDAAEGGTKSAAHLALPRRLDS